MTIKFKISIYSNDFLNFKKSFWVSMKLHFENSVPTELGLGLI